MAEAAPVTEAAGSRSCSLLTGHACGVLLHCVRALLVAERRAVLCLALAEGDVSALGCATP